MADKNIQPLPDTVGEFIELLQKYPADAKLDFKYIEGYYNENGSPTSASHADTRYYDGLNWLDITIN